MAQHVNQSLHHVCLPATLFWLAPPEIAQLKQHRQRKARHAESLVGRRVQRVVHKVRHERRKAPVVAAVPEEVGEDRHRVVAELVHEDGLQDALGVVAHPVGARQLLHQGVLLGDAGEGTRGQQDSGWGGSPCGRIKEATARCSCNHPAARNCSAVTAAILHASWQARCCFAVALLQIVLVLVLLLLLALSLL